jgi:hypothetical protein
MSPKQDLGLKEDIQCWIIYGHEQQWQAMYLRSQLKFTETVALCTISSHSPISNAHTFKGKEKHQPLGFL